MTLAEHGQAEARDYNPNEDVGSGVPVIAIQKQDNTENQLSFSFSKSNEAANVIAPELE